MTADTITSEIRHTIGLDGLVHLGIRGGRIHVQGIAGTDAVVRSSGDGSLDRLQIERGDRSLSVRAASTARLDLRHGGSDTPLDVQVPVGATIVVDAASADVALDGLSGEQRVRTASGDISVHGAGGVISAEAMSGDVRIEVTGSASLDLRTVSGDLAALVGSIRRLRAFTTSGDLSIAGRFDGDGPFDVVTVSGDVELAPSEAALRVEVRSITGGLQTDLPHRVERMAGHRTLVIGGGGPLVDVRSTSGDITVVAPRSTEPPAAIEPPATTPSEDAPTPSEDAPTLGGSSEVDPRLDVLRALERGDIDLDTARLRLETIDRSEEVDHAG